MTSLIHIIVVVVVEYYILQKPNREKSPSHRPKKLLPKKSAYKSSDVYIAVGYALFLQSITPIKN